MKIAKKSKISLRVLLVLAPLAATCAHGATINLGYGSHHSGNGGEFAVKPRTNGTAAEKAASTAYVAGIMSNYSPLACVVTTNSLGETVKVGFETFCIEYNQHFSPGTNYNVDISPAARSGGNTVSDTVSVGTAYLYGLFAKGQLPGYNYTSNTSAGNLQNTFWYLENERLSLPSGAFIANPGIFDSLLTAEFGNNPAAWRADSAVSTSYGLVTAASFGVAALNVGDSPTFVNQDQLVYQGGGYQRVPDGGTTLTLVFLSLGGLAFMKRRLA